MKYEPTKSENDSLVIAIEALHFAIQKIAFVRSEVCLAGVGTYGLQKEYAFLAKLDAKLIKIKNKAQARQKAGYKNVSHLYSKLTLPVQ